MQHCRIGVIGAGRIGKCHVENIYARLPQFSLMGIADPNIDIQWANRFRIPIITKDWGELIHHDEIDALLIASPSDLHASHILAGSKAEKAIFCEKPLCFSEEEAKMISTVTKENDTFLQLGFNRRFDSHFSNVANRVKSGEIGQPHLVQITSRDPHCPTKDYCRQSGGLFMDMTIHDFDMARFLMQSEVIEVYANGAALIDPSLTELNDIDTAIIQLSFENGALGVINNSRQAVYGYDQRIEVFGSLGSLIANHQRQNSVEFLNAQGTHLSNPLYFFLERYQTSYITELEAFYLAWSQRRPSPVNAYDGLQAIRIAQSAKKSLQLKQAVRVDTSNFFYSPAFSLAES